jgi:hypothetical protein
MRRLRGDHRDFLAVLVSANESDPVNSFTPL